MDNGARYKEWVIKVCKKLTVFTPTFNRAYCLHNLYESLLRQTSKDFLWLVIDDGSTDDTRELVTQWASRNGPFPIEYVYKENGGMHTAHNKAYELIETELNMCVDSDDYLTDDAVEKIIKKWETEGTEGHSGIIGLDIYADGKVIGKSLPAVRDVRLCDYYAQGGKGDKKLVFRTSVMQKYPPYPVFEDERFVPLGYKYVLADQDYRLLVLNEPVCVVEYMEDGSTKNIYRQYVMNPKGFSFSRKVQMQYGVRLIDRFRAAVHYVSHSIVARNSRFIEESPKKVLTMIAIPLGLGLYAFTLYKVSKNR